MPVYGSISIAIGSQGNTVARPLFIYFFYAEIRIDVIHRHAIDSTWRLRVDREPTCDCQEKMKMGRLPHDFLKNIIYRYETITYSNNLLLNQYFRFSKFF